MLSIMLGEQGRVESRRGLPAAPVECAASPYSGALRTRHPAETALIRESRAGRKGLDSMKTTVTTVLGW